MILSPDEAVLFFAIWASLDAFVNRRKSVVAGYQTAAECRAGTPRNLRTIRDALRADPGLLDAFVAENPDALSDEALAEARGFRHAVRGKFYVERILKGHAVFVSTANNRVYLVGGLTDGVGEVLSRGQPVGYALLVETVLLPFRGRIVWDGIVGGHNVSFGPGIRENYKEAYLRAKERGELISVLDGSSKPRLTTRTGPDPRPAVDAVIRAVGQLSKPATGLQGAAFKLLKPAADLAVLTLDDRLDGDQLRVEVRALRRALKAVETALVRADIYPG